MSKITIVDSMLGECELDFNWAWSRAELGIPEKFAVDFSGGRCRFGRIVSGDDGVSFEALAYRYGVDELGVPSDQPERAIYVAIQYWARLAVRSLKAYGKQNDPELYCVGVFKGN